MERASATNVDLDIYVETASATKVDLCIFWWRKPARRMSAYIYFNMAKASATCVDFDKCTVMFLFYSSVIWTELCDVPRPGSLLHACARVCLLACSCWPQKVLPKERITCSFHLLSVWVGALNHLPEKSDFWCDGYGSVANLVGK